MVYVVVLIRYIINARHRTTRVLLYYMRVYNSATDKPFYVHRFRRLKLRPEEGKFINTIHIRF